MSMSDIAQTICLAVYLIGSLAAVALAIWFRDGLKNVNRAKELLRFQPDADASQLPASFSRTVGLVGTIYLCVFLWCIGLLLLTGSALIAEPSWSDALQKYILACSALFAPYAFNQLAQIFPLQAAAPASSSKADPTALADPIPPPHGIP